MLASNKASCAILIEKCFLRSAMAHSGAITMTNSPQKTILCITSYEKGQEFIRECKRQGAYVIFLTVTALQHANWPRESIDEIYYVPDLSKSDEVIRGVSFLARDRKS